ncbi:SUMF1/EgtB/PvdO family nonheme iron enzyme [bacterium]|nr:SUMF1/EgtB/PvdO family nonheme iron enzyme [candidate division CSSED10-310 bacterium]
MRKKVISAGIAGLLIWGCAVPVSLALAATVDGNAYKFGQTDHSGISIHLSTMPTVPTTGVLACGFLLGGISLILFSTRSEKKKNNLLILILGVLASGCFAYAYVVYDTTTLSTGAYSLLDVETGVYRLEASAPGYYPEEIASVTVVTGPNTLSDITLYPMETPTPFATETPTFTPTADPTQTPTMAPTFTPLPPGTLVSIDNIIGTMRFVPNGNFTQGAPVTEPCRNNEVQFFHIVRRDLAVMETELTRQMWADLLVVQTTLPSDPSNTTVSPGMVHPLNNLTWQEAILFANLLSLENGFEPCYYTDAAFTMKISATNYITGPYYCNFDALGYRLPSEGEWEYFARAGTTTAFSCDEPAFDSTACTSCVSGRLPSLEQHAVFCANRPVNGPAEVGTKLPNPWNLYDVHGNLMEFCWDWSAVYPYGTVTDYTGPETGSRRIYRGGHYSTPTYLRSARRGDLLPDYRTPASGLRLVRTLFY